jgi:hypothetical protein
VHVVDVNWIEKSHGEWKPEEGLTPLAEEIGRGKSE